jgi:hypothetical protein
LTLDQLTGGTEDPVLVVDFVQFSSARLLSEELSTHSNGHPVYRIDPVTDLARDQTYRPLDVLAEGYVAECIQQGLARRRLAVVGYCSAAALSLCIAARLAGFSKAGSILVQPTWPDAEMIAADFGSFRADLGAKADSFPDPDADPDLALRQMQGVLHDDLRAMAAVHGLDPGSAALAEMLARYRSWLGFLLSSSDALRRPWRHEIRPHVLLGADADPVMPWFGADAYRVIRLPVSDKALLSDAKLADWVLASAWSWDDRAAQ